MGTLREELAGYLSHHTFADKILSGKHILSSAFVKEVVSCCESEQHAHRDFVETLLKGAGIR